jgi:WD40 repeat protein
MNAKRLQSTVWNATTGAVLRRVTREDYRTGSVAITRDGHVVSDWIIDQQNPHGGTTFRRTFTVWDRLTGKELRVLDGENGYGDIAIDPKGRWIVVPCEDGIQLWDVESGRKLRGLRPPAANPVAVSRDGTRVVAVDRDNRMHVWEAEGDAAAVSTGQIPKIHASCCSPDGSRIAGASDDGVVRLWSTTAGTEVDVLRGHASAVKAITWSDDGRWILSGGEDGFVRVWDAATGTEADLIRVDGMPLVLVLRKDRLYVGCWNRTVCVYEWKPRE